MLVIINLDVYGSDLLVIASLTGSYILWSFNNQRVDLTLPGLYRLSGGSGAWVSLSVKSRDLLHRSAN